MTIEEIREDFELVAIEFLEVFNVDKLKELSVREGIIRCNGYHKGGFISKNTYLERYNNGNYYYDSVRKYYNGFLINVNLTSYDVPAHEILIEYVEEISKKICIQTGYKLSKFEVYTENRLCYLLNGRTFIGSCRGVRFLIYELPLKFTLVDPLNPALQSFRQF